MSDEDISNWLRSWGAHQMHFKAATELDRLRAELAAKDARIAALGGKWDGVVPSEIDIPQGKRLLFIQIKALQQALAAARQERDNIASLNSSLISQKEAANARIAEVESARGQCIADYNALRKEIADIKNDRSDFWDHASLRKELAEAKVALEQQTAVVEGQMRYYNAALEAAKARIAELENNNESGKDEVQASS